MSSKPTLQSVNKSKNFAWVQYFRLLDIHKTMCERIKNIDINQIPESQTKLHILSLYKNSTNFLICSICSKDMHKSTDDRITITKCSHVFHKECLEKLDVILCPECSFKI